MTSKTVLMSSNVRLNSEEMDEFHSIFDFDVFAKRRGVALQQGSPGTIEEHYDAADERKRIAQDLADTNYTAELQKKYDVEHHEILHEKQEMEALRRVQERMAEKERMRAIKLQKACKKDNKLASKLQKEFDKENKKARKQEEKDRHLALVLQSRES